MVKIISDSTCDLSQELLRKYEIDILPLHILLGDKEYEDGKNITPDQIYAWSDANKTTPKTSAPALADAMELFRPYAEAGREIVCFSISAGMSTSGNVMRLAAEELGASDRIKVIDSANLSTGIGLLVVEAAIMAKNNRTASQIVSEIEKLKPNVRASFVVDTLTYLYRGGRCNAVAAMAGGVLKLHPRIVVENGAMNASKKYRGKINSVIMDYVKDMEKDLTKGPILKTLLLFALPMMLGNLLQQIYNITDTIIVGRVLGSGALAAVGSTYTLMTFLTSVILGLCLGSGALFSMRFGQRDEKTLRGSLCASFFFIAVVTAFLNIFAYVFLDKLRIFLRVPLEAWGDMREYLFVIFIGIPDVGVVGIWWSVPIGWILADLAGLLYYKNKRKRLLSFL